MKELTKGVTKLLELLKGKKKQDILTSSNK